MVVTGGDIGGDSSGDSLGEREGQGGLATLGDLLGEGDGETFGVALSARSDSCNPGYRGTEVDVGFAKVPFTFLTEEVDEVCVGYFMINLNSRSSHGAMQITYCFVHNHNHSNLHNLSFQAQPNFHRRK